MNLLKRKFLAVLLSATVLACLIGIVICLNVNTAFADSSKEVSLSSEVFDDDTYIVATYTENIPATYEYIRLNETECSVQITNKAEATTALIPAEAIINGQTYTVTEIASSGFSSSPKLARVSLPDTVIKIGKNAFSNCSELTLVSLGNVQEIGNTAFYNCPKLSELIIPKTVEVVGSNVFRNNNTLVRVRADHIGDGWSSKWNTSNGIEEPELNSKVREKIVLEPNLNYNARSNINEVTGYSIASRQSLSEETFEVVNGNYFIKSCYSNGKPINTIEDFAFAGVKFNQLIIEYSETPIAIGSNAFQGTIGQSVTINRSLYYCDDEGDYIFEDSTINSIALPQNVSGIAEGMFSNCVNLTNIYFIEPEKFNDREDQLGIITREMKNCKSNTVYLPEIESFTSIGSSAFRGAIGIKELHIPQNVKNVGATIFREWSDDQIVYVDYRVDDLPQYDSSTGNGWHIDWRGSFNIDNIKFKGYVIFFEDHYTEHTYAPKETSVDAQIGKLPTPTEDGMIFKGWFTENGVQYTSDTIFKDNANITLYAKWVYEINYLNNDNTFITKREVVVGEDTILVRFTKKGYTGYLKSDENKRYEFGDLFTPNRSYSFIVNWEELPIEDCEVTILYPYREHYYEIYGPNQLRDIGKISTKGSSTSLTIKIMNDIDVTDKDWSPIPNLTCCLDGQGHTITFKNTSVSGNSNFGFFDTIDGGWVRDIKFKTKIKVSDGTESGKYVGVVAAMLKGGCIEYCEVLKWENNPSYTYSFNNNVDVLVLNPRTIVGGIVGYNIATIQDCTNNASIAGHGWIGGLVGENQMYIRYGINNGDIFYDHNGEDSNVGGIAGFHYAQSYLAECKNYATIYFQRVSLNSQNNAPCLAQIVGYVYYKLGISHLEQNELYGSVYVSGYVNGSYTSRVTNGEYADYYDDTKTESQPCVTPDTLITLADGSQKQVQYLTGSEMLLVWNLYTGTFDIAPILFIDSESASLREVINLYFSDGTEVKVIYEHAFWNFNLNEYVFLRNDAAKYIGHWFNKQTTDELGNMSWGKVQLVDVVVKEEITTSWSPVTYGHLCYYVNGMLSMPGATEGLINIFEVDSETLKIDEVLMQNDIETYGLYTYEEFAEIYPITEEMFEAFCGQYLKISIGKGLIALEQIGELINRYAEFLN